MGSSYEGLVDAVSKRANLHVAARIGLQVVSVRMTKVDIPIRDEARQHELPLHDWNARCQLRTRYEPCMPPQTTSTARPALLLLARRFGAHKSHRPQALGGYPGDP
jgi:hypothetical protein